MSSAHQQLLLPPASIDIVDRLRPVDYDFVAVIAASMEQRGQDQPIIVRLVEGRHRLVAGAHRHAAALALEWQTIRCELQDLDDDQARLCEIDENLARRELAPLDRSIFLTQRKQTWDRLHPDAGDGGDRRSEVFRSHRVRSDRFSRQAADKTGLSERPRRCCGSATSRPAGPSG